MSNISAINHCLWANCGSRMTTPSKRDQKAGPMTSPTSLCIATASKVSDQMTSYYDAVLSRVLRSHLHSHWQIEGVGAPWNGCMPPSPVQFLSFLCGFQGKLGKIIAWRPNHLGWRPRLGNPGYATDSAKLRLADLSTFLLVSWKESWRDHNLQWPPPYL